MIVHEAQAASGRIACIRRPTSDHDRPRHGRISPDIRVLLVDDDVDALQMAKDALRAGATVVTASSAVEALETLDGSVFDVAMFDIGMPEVDGYQLLKRMRQRSADRRGRLPAAALTAYARSSRSHAVAEGRLSDAPVKAGSAHRARGGSGVARRRTAQVDQTLATARRPQFSRMRGLGTRSKDERLGTCDHVGGEGLNQVSSRTWPTTCRVLTGPQRGEVRAAAPFGFARSGATADAASGKGARRR